MRLSRHSCSAAVASGSTTVISRSPICCLTCTVTGLALHARDDLFDHRVAVGAEPRRPTGVHPSSDQVPVRAGGLDGDVAAVVVGDEPGDVVGL